MLAVASGVDPVTGVEIIQEATNDYAYTAKLTNDKEILAAEVATYWDRIVRLTEKNGGVFLDTEQEVAE